MLAVTSAHATTPDERAAYQASCGFTSASTPSPSRGTWWSSRRLGRGPAVTPVPSSSAGAASSPSTITALASPSAHHASGPRATTATTPGVAWAAR